MMCEYSILIFKQPQLRAEIVGLKVRDMCGVGCA
jgi:hypothetical protein